MLSPTFTSHISLSLHETYPWFLFLSWSFDLSHPPPAIDPPFFFVSPPSPPLPDKERRKRQLDQGKKERKMDPGILREGERGWGGGVWWVDSDNVLLDSQMCIVLLCNEFFFLCLFVLYSLTKRKHTQRHRMRMRERGKERETRKKGLILTIWFVL